MNKSSLPTAFPYFESLFKNSVLNAVMVMDTSGNIQSVNPAFTKAFGYTTNDLKGRNFSLLFIPKDVEAGKPAKELEAVMSKGQGDDKNYLVKKDGSFVWVSGETVKVDDGNGNIVLLKLIQDIHVQKEAELTIIRSNDFNESILTTIDDIVIVLNKNMNIIKANPAFYSLFKNVSPQKAISNFANFIAPFDKTGLILEHINKLKNTGQSFNNLEIEINTPGGERVFDISGRTMQTEQNQDALLFIVHEITIQKQLVREREDIIGFVAHELRNPLSNLLLCNEMLKQVLQNNEPGEADKLMQRSQNNIFRLNKMIGELYEATRLSAGSFMLEKTEFDFDEMISEAIDTVQVLQPAFNIIGKGKAGKAYGDRYRLMQVVTNYLSNGIKYSNGQKDVKISVQKNSHNIIVSVEDEGLGIPANQLPYIFDRFFRAEKTKNLEGIGLGLFLCRRIIDAHGGKLWASSEEGRGSKFYFSIPV